MVLYETLKFVHIVAVAVWLGGGLTLTAFGASGRREERITALASINAWVGPRVFAPAALLLIAFGVWATLEGDWDFGDTWITIGFVVFALGFIAGPTLHERNARAPEASRNEHGSTAPPTLAIARRELAVGAVEVALLTFAVWAMTAKPGL